MMITPEISKFMENERLGFVATVTPDCKPNISPKGSVVQYGEAQIVFADIRSPKTVSNLESNPAVEINVVNSMTRRGYLFVGKGHVVRSGPEFDGALERLRDKGIKSTIDTIVIVDVEVAEEIKSPLYDLGYTEDQIERMQKKRYGLE